MKIDSSLWNNKDRMRERVRNLATMVMSLCAVNGFFAYSQKSWLILGINILFFVTTIPVFMSYSKWRKMPPEVER